MGLGIPASEVRLGTGSREGQVALIGHADLLGRLGHCRTVGQLHVRLPELVDDLLRCVPPPGYLTASLLRPGARNTNIAPGPASGAVRR